MLKRKLLNERELAQLLGCSLSKLRSDRWKGIGIPYIKLNKSVLYCQDDAEAFCRAHRIDPEARNSARGTSEPKGGRP